MCVCVWHKIVVGHVIWNAPYLHRRRKKRTTRKCNYRGMQGQAKGKYLTWIDSFFISFYRFFLVWSVGRIKAVLTLRLLYGRSMRTLAAIDESQTSWSRPPDVGGGSDVIDTDCFIGLVEWVCLSVIEVSIFVLIQCVRLLPSFVYWQRR